MKAHQKENNHIAFSSSTFMCAKLFFVYCVGIESRHPLQAEQEKFCPLGRIESDIGHQTDKPFV